MMTLCNNVGSKLQKTHTHKNNKKNQNLYNTKHTNPTYDDETKLWFIFLCCGCCCCFLSTSCL